MKITAEVTIPEGLNRPYPIDYKARIEEAIIVAVVVPGIQVKVKETETSKKK